MARIVIGTFNSRQDAERAADQLQRSGFGRDSVSLVSRDQGNNANQGQQDNRNQAMMSGNTTDGTMWGAGIGAGAGLLASAGALAIPGIGPLLAVGPLAATLSGAVTGGLAGGLIDWGLPEDRGQFYEQEVKQGRVLCMCRCEDDQAAEAQQVLAEAGASNVETHDSQQ